MTERSDAQKEAQKRYDTQNPIQSVRLPLHTVETLRQAAKDTNQSYRGLLKQILLDWIEKENK